MSSVNDSSLDVVGSYVEKKKAENPPPASKDVILCQTAKASTNGDSNVEVSVGSLDCRSVGKMVAESENKPKKEEGSQPSKPDGATQPAKPKDKICGEGGACNTTPSPS
uniref:Uncharacterized protein n=1 Tax=Candidatus Kentrum sp. FM TaxID=2126340 RepID=A0A450STF0_9GAMM|nr:MAG: hypothetical protein BECKFM1743A_GA0114220_101881 [Candidatus Kentron sp. FM]VFJ58031.1 MAG: hypothetical protein BECKFM1743C_GA0114222_102148 [Candidatus Kentron sp. FM]VFK11832.1 MAG: hypothetical protein BECKFM1743B_GA0114221_102098 [Candidatus Kentron sp. FM]